MSRNPAAMFWAAIAGVAVLFLGVTAAAGWARVADPAAAVAAAPAAGEPVVVDVALSEFAITPAALTAPAGAPLTFRVTNSGSIDHDFTIVDDRGGTTGLIGAGGSGELEAGPLEPGEYEVLCSVPSHPDAGMRATLTVAEGAVVAPAAGGEPDPAQDHTAHMTPVEMAAAHEQGVLDFPASTQGKGNVLLEPTLLADGTKEFRLVADELQWEVAPGEVKEALAYNGMVPGPRLEADLGDRVRIVLDNQLDEPTSMHLHGLLVPNAMDGVPGLNQDSILPGESFTYEFEVRNSGTHMYHSHFDSAHQVTMGMLGAFVVHDPADPPVDSDHVMVLGDGPLGYTLNGKGFPATEPIVARLGQTVRIRYMNEGLQIHPMHLHGIPQQVIARDGYPLAQPYTLDTVLVAPGERVDVLVEATEPGTWAYHCHILNHAEGADGMFGMVTAMVVEDA